MVAGASVREFARTTLDLPGINQLQHPGGTVNICTR